MILDLLRHGETEQGGLRGSLDDALTDKGWAQMRRAVADGGPWQVLVSSPLQRCGRFADELGAQLNLPVQREPALQELHFGDWEGQSAAQIMEHQLMHWAVSGPTLTPSHRPMASRSRRLPNGCWRLSSVCAFNMPASACCWSPMAASCGCYWPVPVACPGSSCCRSRWAMAR